MVHTAVSQSGGGTRMLSAMVLTVCAVALMAWLLAYLVRQAAWRYQAMLARYSQTRLTDFFLFLEPAQLWHLTLAVTGLLCVAAWLLSGSLWLLCLSGAVGLALPTLLLHKMRQRRLLRFDAQWPDALLSLAGALRAGASVPLALRHIAMQAPVPLAQELGLLLRQQRLGTGFDEALAQLEQRMPTESTGLVVAALRVAGQTGGNLAGILEQMAATLRARLYLQGRIRALTAQGRMQAWIVGSLPLLLLWVLDHMEPDIMAVLWHTPMGWLVLGVLAVLETVGMLLVLRIVRIDV
ncbi:MAG: type II secretion system F family protein [Corticimicrobacter sp.]|uniref:type II secretion system F family protein n=1 Tax=Corticimicrobacter sp. TaxID=2678536 RepID=UPI0032DA5CD9